MLRQVCLDKGVPKIPCKKIFQKLKERKLKRGGGKKATVRSRPTVFRIHVPVAEAELLGGGSTPGVRVKEMVGLLLPKTGGGTPGGRDVTSDHLAA